MKLTLLFTRRWILLYGPILMACIAAIWLSATVWMPLPPQTLTITTGQQIDFTNLVIRYRDHLDAKGIRADLAAGSVTNVAKTVLPDQIKNFAGFAEGMNNSVTSVLPTATPNDEDLFALAAVERLPVWVFTNMPALTNMSQLRGLRIASPMAGTASRKTAELLLAHAGLTASDVVLIEKESKQAANDLIDGKVNVFILVAQIDSEVVQLLTRTPSIQLVGVDRVTALIAREPKMKPFVLPQGAIELRGDIPPNDLTLVASNLHLVANSGMHPALQRALIDVAYELHETPRFLQRLNEFPSLKNMDFVPSPASRSMALGQRPWMEQLLPYRWAQLAELILYAVLPILLITLVALTWIPHFFEWRVNAILQNHYGELKFLEAEIEPTASGRPIDIKRLLQRLDVIEQQVVSLDLPDQFSNRWYTLRTHLAGAREKLLDLRSR